MKRSTIPGRRFALAELIRLTTAAGAPLASHELPPHLYFGLLHHFGGIHRARRAANLPDPPYPRKWTEAAVLAELRHLHRSGVPIRYYDLEQHGREDVVGAVRTYLGSIVRARRLARIPTPPRRRFDVEVWDEDRVLEDILELAKEEKPLAYSKAPRKLVNAGMRYFGSWAAALEAAGFDYDAIRLRRKAYDDEAMLTRIRALAAERPRMTFGQLYDHPDGQATRRRFPSIEVAVKKAGVTGWPIRLMHGLPSRRETVGMLKARYAAGRKLTKAALEAEDVRLLNAIRRHFRSLERALKAAGLEAELEVRIRWTRAEVVRQLARRRDAGLPLHASAVQADMPRLYASAVEFFGSYMAAAARFGAKARQRAWTSDDVLRELRILAKSKKILITSDAPQALLHACARYFGSFDAARRAAGVAGLDRQRWTRERVIKALRDRARKGQLVTGTALGSSLLTASWRYFGSLENALRAARITTRRGAARARDRPLRR